MRLMGQLVTMFLTIFVAELGDKTQMATLLYAAERKDQAFGVFLASASALVLGAAISVLVGAYGGRWLQNVPLKLLAGIGFIVIGVWSLVQYYQGD
jgi:putative Ca2+/H+ antiporter (TMEM165/GDT1 family)